MVIPGAEKLGCISPAARLEEWMGGVRGPACMWRFGGSDSEKVGSSHPLSLSPSTACQRLKFWPSSLQQPSMTMSTQALPTASTSRLSEGWGVAGQEGPNGSGEVARISI